MTRYITVKFTEPQLEATIAGLFYAIDASELGPDGDNPMGAGDEEIGTPDEPRFRTAGRALSKMLNAQRGSR